MTYSEGCVLSVIHKDRPLREHRSGKHTPEVYLPFNSEYSLRIKNRDKNRKIAARVYIDGTDVLSGSHLIIDEEDSTDLERFLGDSNASGNKFKFVSLDDPDVADPSNEAENGLIEVQFYRVKDYWKPSKPILNPIRTHWYGNKDRRRIGARNANNTGNFTAESHQFYSSSSVADDNCALFCCDASAACESESGATVEGSWSNQSFRTVDYDIESNSFTTLKIRMRGLKDKEVPPFKNYCPKCGSKTKVKNRYCSNCGTRL